VQPLINKYVIEHHLREVNLHLGCGGHYLDGWINIDNFDFESHDSSRSGSCFDLKMDIRKLDVDNDSVDKILLIHVIEHFVRWEAVKLLQAFFCKLKYGGALIMEHPDLDGCIDWYRSRQKSIKTPLGDLNMGFTQFYGNQWDELDYETHRYVWTKGEMKQVLEKIGFEILFLDNNAIFHEAGRDMRVVARKPFKDERPTSNEKNIRDQGTRQF
jgi:predicted SAM-dependent methyltransferase